MKNILIYGLLLLLGFAAYSLRNQPAVIDLKCTDSGRKDGFAAVFVNGGVSNSDACDYPEYSSDNEYRIITVDYDGNGRYNLKTEEDNPGCGDPESGGIKL